MKATGKSTRQVVNNDPLSDQVSGASRRSEAQSVEVYAHRTNMTIVHFLFTVPKWSVGLFLFLASYTSPLRTTKSAIQKPVQRLQALVQSESQSYQSCVKSASSRLDRLLNELAAEDRLRLDRIHESNRLHIQEAQKVSNDCLLNTQTVRRSLIQWQTDGMELPWAPVVDSDDNADLSLSPTICTTQRRNQTERLLGQNFQQYEGEVAFALDTYAEDSRNSLELVQSYAVARIDYDYKYFIQDRIQPALDYLAEHTVQIQAAAITFDVNLSQLEAKIQATLYKVKKALEQARGHIDILEEKLKEFVGSINRFHFAYTDLYHRFGLALQFVAELLPPGAQLPDFFDFTILNVPEFYLPATSLTWPELELDYQGIHDMLDAAAQQCILIMMQVLENIQAQVGEQLHGFIRELTQVLTQLLELKDYNPPQFKGSHDGIGSLEDQIKFQTEIGEQVKELTNQALSNLRLQASKVDFKATSIGQPHISAPDYSYEESSTTFEYLSLILPSFSLPEAFITFITWLSVNTWSVEIFFQVYRLWRLETVYAKGAIPDMPEIDYGDGDGDDNEQFQTKYYMLSLVLKGLLRPHLIVVALFFLPLCFVAITMWFPHVHQSCVATSNGTFIGRHILSPLLINQASAQGNLLYLGIEASCLRTQRHICSEIRAESQAQFQKDWTTLNSFHEQRNLSLQSLDLMRTCLDSNEMTAMMKESCCGLKGYEITNCSSLRQFTCPIDSSVVPKTAFLPYERYFSEPSCQRDYFKWSLEDTSDDCHNLLKVCNNIPCAGVNKSLIRDHAVKTDCEVELYAMDSCYFLLSFFFHALSINMICSLIFQGLRQLQWRQLCPTGIKLKTQLQEDGTLAKGYEVDDRSDRIAKAVRHFEFLGKFQIILGMVSFVLYVIMTSVLIVKK
ncbi:hypothetical protein IV203_007207 [Nitzschia inconspicua]|uniref:Uncharacterized protein n=1 Tax=Nitzschia inconspicua TaxID=303405 RepID=A0A9K3PCQ6_9STRA|nr:hypothetical protein IV203_007207 [Nitzschia inconspicua]